MNPNKNIIKNEKIMKRSYENAVVDIMLLILLIAVTVSGVKLHVLISHGHTDLHTWIIIHVICGLAMLTTILLHIRYHWKSYISRKTLRGKITFCYLLSLASLLLQDSYCCWLSVGLIRSWD